MKNINMSSDLEVINIFGRRGSGKTTKLKELLKDKKRKRIFVYDLKDEYPFKKVRGRQELWRFLKQNWFKPFKIAYIPTSKETPQHIEELSQICYRFCQAQKKDFDNNIGGNISIVIEEMSVTAPNQKYPNGQGGLNYAVNVAREWGVELIGVSQRPAQANPDFRGNASDCYYFALSDKLDRGAVSEKIGKQQAEDLISFKPHEFIRFHDGVTTKGKNKLSL